MNLNRPHPQISSARGAATALAFVALVALAACGAAASSPTAPGFATPEPPATPEYVPLACSVADPAALPGRVTAASPLVSVGKVIAASGGVVNAQRLVDGSYTHTGASLGTPTESSPTWIAIDVGAGPQRLLLLWSDVGWTNYNDTTGGAPLAYRIETSSDSTDGSNGTWSLATTVADNPVRVREHSFGFTGQRWVRFVVTAGQSAGGGAVTLDEIALYDVSSANGARPADTWFFMGDSITAGAIRRNLGVGTSFDEIVHAKHPSHDPILIAGGIGGELATHGRAHLEQWLQLNPDILHFLIGYGTNDSWGDKDPVAVGFEETLEGIVSGLLDAGRVPILARIPYASTAHTTVERFNEVIERVRARHGLPCGPDLYAWFRQHPEQLSSDGVHPASTGYASINRLWAEAVDVLYPAN